MTDHHNIPTVRSIDWATIRLRYMRGETPYAIAKSLQGRPTRQWISRKAKQEGWAQGLPGIVASSHLERPTRSPSKDTPERREQVIEILSKGGTFRLAAAAIAISPNTLKRWRDLDNDFDALCQAAMAQFALAQLQKVADSRDTKDARFLLQHHPVSRDDFRDTRDSGTKIEITFAIPRHPSELATMGLIEAQPERRLMRPVSASAGG